MEAQIASISDDIAYNNHDLEDGLRAGLFSIEKLKSIPLISKIIKKHTLKLNKFRKEIIISQVVRDLINIMVVDVISNTNKNIKKSNPQSLNDIFKKDYMIVDFSDKMKNIDSQLKIFLRQNMYNHKKVIVNTNKGKKIIKKLFDYLMKKPKKFIHRDILKDNSKERAISDFIAGMTDRYAINLHKKLK